MSKLKNLNSRKSHECQLLSLQTYFMNLNIDTECVPLDIIFKPVSSKYVMLIDVINIGKNIVRQQLGRIIYVLGR